MSAKKNALPRFRMNLSKDRLFITGIVAVAFAVLFFVRLIQPAADHTGFWDARSVLHLNRAMALSETGSIPALSRPGAYDLSFYKSGILFHKVVNLFRHIRLNDTMVIFLAFMGSLIFVPTLLISYELYGNRALAIGSGVLAGLMPVYLSGSMGHVFQTTGLGLSLALASVFFFLRMFKAKQTRDRVLHAFLTLLFLSLACKFWPQSIHIGVAYWVVLIYHACISRGKSCRKDPWPYAVFLVGFILIICARGGLADILIQIAPRPTHSTMFRDAGTLSVFMPGFLSASAVFFVFYFVKHLSRRLSGDMPVMLILIVYFLVSGSAYAADGVFLAPLAAIASGESIQNLKRLKRVNRISLYSLIGLILAKTAYDAVRVVMF